MFDLRGRTALVTGASSGLGARFAVVLARAGATVAVSARRADRLAELAASDPRIVALPCDISDDAERGLLIERCVDTIGGLDILVNNAGIQASGDEADLALDEFRRVVDVNLTALYDLCTLAAGPMASAGTGSIINVASILGLVGSAPIEQASYTASKGGVISLTRQLAARWACDGVRVNALAPGFFPTEMTSDVWSEDATQKWIRRNTPMARTGRLEELDGPLLLLACQAGSYMTGQVIAVDGGWTAG